MKTGVKFERDGRLYTFTFEFHAKKLLENLLQMDILQIEEVQKYAINNMAIHESKVDARKRFPKRQSERKTQMTRIDINGETHNFDWQDLQLCIDLHLPEDPEFTVYLMDFATAVFDLHTKKFLKCERFSMYDNGIQSANQAIYYSDTKSIYTMKQQRRENSERMES